MRVSLPDVVIGGAITLVGGGAVAWLGGQRADRADKRRFAHERELEHDRRGQDRLESTYVSLLEFASQAFENANREVQDRVLELRPPPPPGPMVTPDDPHRLLATMGAFASDEVRKLGDAFENNRRRVRMTVWHYEVAKGAPTSPGATELAPHFEAMEAALAQLREAREALRGRIAEELKG
ncbi:MAG TPA: hypothetical protein VGF70_08545 [Solirubrobacteraceae bacterium]